MTQYTTPPPTTIDAGSTDAFERIKAAPLAILCGRNNSGKSYLLRQLLRQHGQKASYLGPARYSNFNVLAPYGPRQNRKAEKFQLLLRHYQNATLNTDNSPINVQQAIAELSDEQREALFNLIEELLGSKVRIQQTVPGNSMSQMYIDADGYNLSFTSSGFRLVTTLLTSLLDTDYTHVLIDEPELGLSPEVQGVFADWLLDPSKRGTHLAHIRSVVIATHSPIFLDRRNLGNNYIVDKVGTTIKIRNVQSVQDLNVLQFRLLGNRFETLFLPSAILLVEGETDYNYLSRLVALRHPNSIVSIVRAFGDGRMKEIVAMAKQMLGDIARGPYARRFFVVLDSVHGRDLEDRLIAMGIPADNIITWSMNGIEYLYPKSILEARFGNFDAVAVDGDRVTIGSHVLTKRQLNEIVLGSLTGHESYPEEFATKLLKPLDELLY